MATLTVDTKFDTAVQRKRWAVIAEANCKGFCAASNGSVDQLVSATKAQLGDGSADSTTV